MAAAIVARLTATEAAALLGSGFARCGQCGAWIVVRIYAFNGGPNNGPKWQPLPVPVSPVTGAVHECQLRSDDNGSDS